MNFAPVAAMAMGPESVPIAGEVQFRDGLLVMPRHDDHATGISLLWTLVRRGHFNSKQHDCCLGKSRTI